MAVCAFAEGVWFGCGGAVREKEFNYKDHLAIMATTVTITDPGPTVNITVMTGLSRGYTVEVSADLAGQVVYLPGYIMGSGAVLRGLGEERPIITESGKSSISYFQVKSGVTMEHIELASNFPVVIPGSGDLTLKDTKVNSSIQFAPGAELHIENSIFTRNTVFVLTDWSGSTADSLTITGLDTATFEQSELNIAIGSLAGATTLTPLSWPCETTTYVQSTALSQDMTLKAGVTLWNSNGSQFSGTLTGEAGSLLMGTFNLSSATLKGTLTLASGASINAITIGEGTTFICRSGSTLTAGATVNSGGVLTLNGAQVNSSLLLYHGAKLEVAAGTSFDEGSSLILRNWEGSTGELCAQLARLSTDAAPKIKLADVASGKTATLVALPWAGAVYEQEGAYLSQTLILASGATLRGNDKMICGTLVGEVGSLLEGNINLYNATLKGELTLATGASLRHANSYPFSISGGATLICRSGAVITSAAVIQTGGELRLEAGFELTRNVTVNSGALLKLEGAQVSSALELEGGAQLELTAGTSFAEGGSIVLTDWEGSTEQLCTQLAKLGEDAAPEISLASVPAEKKCTLMALPWAGAAYTQSGALAGTVVLAGGATLRGNGGNITGTLEGEVGSLLTGTLKLKSANLKGTHTLAEGAQADIACIAEGTTLVCREGSSLSAELTVESGGVLELEPGFVLTENVTVKSGGVLRLNGVRVEGSITLEAGARLEGSGNTFTNATPIILSNWSGSAADAFSGLKNCSYEQENSVIVIKSVAGDAVLEAHAGEDLSFSLQGSIGDGAKLVLKPGVTLEVKDGSVAKGGTLVCEAGAVLNGELRVENGAALVAPSDITNVDLCPGSQRSENGVDFELVPYVVTKTTGSAGEFGSLSDALSEANLLANQDFVIQFDSSLAGETITAKASSVVSLDNIAAQIKLEEGMTLKTDCSYGTDVMRLSGSLYASYATETSAISTQELRVELGYINFINAGIESSNLVNITDGGYVLLQGGSIVTKKLTISDESTLSLQGGAIVEGNTALSGGSLTATDTLFKGYVDCREGTATLTDCAVEGYFILKDAGALANVSNVELRGEEAMRIVGSFTGDTADFWTQGRFTVTNPTAYVTLEELGGKAVLSPLPEGMSYRLLSNGNTWFNTQSVIRIKEGASVDVQNGSLQIAGRISFSSTAVSDVFVCGGDLSTVKGDMTIHQNSHVQLKNGSIRLDNDLGYLNVNAGGLLEMTGGVLSVNSLNGIFVGGAQSGNDKLAGELKLNGVDLTSPTAETGVGGMLNIQGNVELENLTVAPSTQIWLLNLAVDMGGEMTAEQVVFGAGTSINVAQDCELTLTNCRFEGGGGENIITIDPLSGNVSIHGCDLSQISNLFIREPKEGAKIDLSGNYWGTTDIEEIRSSVLFGYDEDYVILDDILTAPPSMPPTLKELAWQSTKLSANSSQVTFSWAGENATSYELTVNGKTYTLTGTTKTLTLKDGNHSWSVRAVAANGKTTTLQGESFTTDTLAPELRLQQPQLGTPAQGEVQVTFSWDSGEAATYELTVDGTVYKVDGTSHTLTLREGEHTWSVTATDAAGNSTTVDGKPFISDGDVTEFALLEPKRVSGSAGKSAVTLSWTGERNSLYTLKLAGKTIKTSLIRYDASTDTYSYTTTLKDGMYEYSVTAGDSSGNTGEKSATLVLDTKAPKLTLKKPKLSKVAEGRVKATLSWSGEAGALYTVTLQGEAVPVYVGYDSQCIIELPLDAAGKRYAVTATDAAGNTSTSVLTHKYALLSDDAVSPELMRVNTVITKRSKGKATVQFSWVGRDDVTTRGLRYTLVVDGRKLYSGTAATRNISLADGEHSYSVIVTDKAGNVSEEKTGTITIDATAPVLTVAVPQLSYGTNEGTGEVTLSWSSDDADATYTLTLDGRVVYKGKDKSYTLSLADGKHSYAVTASDALGNTSSAKKGSFSVSSADTTAPLAVALKPVTTKKYKDGLVKATIKWTPPAGEKGLTYTLMVDGEVVSIGSSASRTLTLADGKHSYSVIATDKAGNSSTAAIGSFESADVTAPVVADLSYTEIDKLEYIGRTEGQLTWSCGEEPAEQYLKVDGTTWYAERAEDGSYRLSLFNLKDGKHTYSLTVVDATGNKATYSGSFVTDTKAPKVTLGKPRLSEGAGGTVDATLSWKGEKGATYTLTVDGRAVELSDPSATSHLLRGLSDGEHSYSVIATDAAGNESKAATGSFFYDTTAPDIILNAITGTATTSKGITRTTATLSWAGEDGVSYTVKVDGKKLSVRKLTVNKQTVSTLSATTGKLTAGEHSYSIIAKDKAGNVSTYSGVFSCDGSGAVTMEGLSPTVIPEGTQRLEWSSWDSEGFGSDETPTGASKGYSFELTQARQLEVKLSGLAEEATVLLQKEGAYESITLRANAGATLDRELSLSAGTYYLQVLGAEGTGALASAYTLDLELEKNGSKQPLQQGVLA